MVQYRHVCVKNLFSSSPKSKVNTEFNFKREECKRTDSEPIICVKNMYPGPLSALKYIICHGVWS